MKGIRYIFAVVILLFTVNIQSANAQSLETQMRNFFSYNNNRAYWWLSKFAHPMNTFSSGYCEMSGSNLYITIHSSSYTLKMRIHKNGYFFDSIEVLEDDDYYPAFQASNTLKNLFIDFLRDYSPQTINKIESHFGNLYNLSSKQMCLAVLTALLLSHPSNSSSSSYSYGSNNFYGSGKITYRNNTYYFKMSLSVSGNNVNGKYIVTNGANEWVELSGTVNNNGKTVVYEFKNGKPTSYYFEGYLNSSSFSGKYKTTSRNLIMDFYASSN